MYSSSLIGLQWAKRIAAIDDELSQDDLCYGVDVDGLLEQRKRLTDAMFYSGEAPTRV